LAGPKGNRRARRGSEVHRGLVGARELIGTPYLADPVLRGEYAREIAPRTEAALARVLDEVYGASARAPARALDLGAGTGAAGRAVRARFGGAVEIVEVDRTAGPGVVRANLAVELPEVAGRFDLIVAAHLLNELYVDRPPADRIAPRAARVLAWVKALLATDGQVVLIEPALRETSRDLLAVRDRLLTAGLHVVAPCFWRGPCPALARPRDWCHDAAPVPSSPRVDFSYLVLRQTPSPPPDPGLFRVVSDRLPENGRLRLYGCGAAGRHALIRLDRDASAANAPFGELVRGSVARIGETRAAGDGLRVTPETSVLPRAGETGYPHHPSR
jgi:hypothetical protein